MNLRLWAVALRSLGRHPRRSLVMALAVAVALACFSGVYTVSDRARLDAVNRVRNMLGTTDTLLVRPGASSRGMVSIANIQPTLKPADAEAIAALPGVAEVGQLLNAFAIEAKYHDQDTVLGVFGVTPNWLSVRHELLARGAFIDQRDEQERNRVAVLGRDVAVALFGREDPIGKVIRLEEIPFEVKGLLAPLGAGPTGFSLDNVVDIPLSTASRRLLNRDILTMAVVRLTDPDHSAEAGAEITALLRRRHQLATIAPADFNITDPKAVIAQFTRVTTVIGRLLNALALASLVVGGAIVAILMQLAVGHRRREIGLLRALGASRGDIVVQFAAEAITVSTIGGAVGILLGVAAANAIAMWQKLPGLISPAVISEALVLSVAIGLVFGLYPAISAARVDPVIALRGQ